MSVYVDPARSDDEPVGVDVAFCPSILAAYDDDLIAVDRHIAGEFASAGAVDNGAAPNDDVVPLGSPASFRRPDLGQSSARGNRRNMILLCIDPDMSGVCAVQIDRKWVERNLGFDPIGMPPPASTFAFSRAARTSDPDDLQREIIDFDSASSAGLQFLAFTTATGLSRYVDVPWPAGLAPRTGPKPRGGGDGPLPRADALVVTWTVDEGHALSRVLTPGKDSHDDYVSYTHNFTTISKRCGAGAPQCWRSDWERSGRRPSAPRRW
jgi:hypothetical protein